jgi:hypothetical protein
MELNGWSLDRGLNRALARAHDRDRPRARVGALDLVPSAFVPSTAPSPSTALSTTPVTSPPWSVQA